MPGVLALATALQITLPELTELPEVTPSENRDAAQAVPCAQIAADFGYPGGQVFLSMYCEPEPPGAVSRQAR